MKLPASYVDRSRRKLGACQLFIRVLLIAFIVTPGFVHSVSAQQTGEITGRVTDAQTGEAMPGVNVIVAGTQLGEATDTEGYFTIEGVPAGEHTVEAMFLGYTTERRRVEVVPGESVEVNFELEASTVYLEETVVTGTAGGERRRAVGNVVSQINATDVLESAPVSNLQEMISGRSPGTVVMTGTGMVGSGSQIRIRGLSSFSLSTDPLIYIDGVRVDNSTATGPNVQGAGGVISRLNDIPPSDIESVEIIKGPAAATLYGTEASNGVIQIITKRGMDGRPRIDFTTRQGASWLHNPQSRIPTNYWRNPQSGDVETLNMYERGTNELGHELFRTGHTQDYALSARGGAENIRYYVGGNFSRDEGAELDNVGQRTGFRANVSVTPTNTLNIDTGLDYTSGRYDLSREGGFGGTMWALLMALPQTVGTPTEGYNLAPPPVWREAYDDFQEFNRTTVSIQADHQPVDWFTQRLVVGLDRVNESNQQVAEQMPQEYVAYFGPTDALGYKNITLRELRNTTLDYSASLNVGLNERVASTTTAGVQYYRKYTEIVSASGEEFPAPDLRAIDATARTFGGNSSIENATLGVFLQEQVSLNDRLFVTAAVRADDNSAFGRDFGFAFYPKASLSWVVSEEPFWSVPFVEQLRVRGAYGQSGQQPDAFAALRTFQPVTGPDDRAAVIPEFVGNPNLGPERGEEIELGVDFSVLSDRLGVEFSYYNTRTKDAILLRDVPPSSGFPEAQFVNAGEIRNSGFEALLRGRPVDAENVRWGLTLNLSTNNNEVINLIGDEQQIVLGDQQHRIGYPVASWFQREVISADLDEQGQAVNLMCSDGEGGSVPCAEAPRVYLGRSIPDLEGAISSTLTLFDRVDVYAMMDFQLGHKRYDATTLARCVVFQLCEGNVYPERFDPETVAVYQSGGLYVSELINDAGFAKLREVSVRYTVPQDWASSFGLQRATVGLAARNLLTITNWTGIDPELLYLDAGHFALEQNNLPPLTQLQFTVNLSF